jgi:hypothetical protein
MQSLSQSGCLWQSQTATLTGWKNIHPNTNLTNQRLPKAYKKIRGIADHKPDFQMFLSEPKMELHKHIWKEGWRI